MNNVYRQLRDNFSADQSYKGRDVQQVILATVKVSRVLASSTPEIVLNFTVTLDKPGSREMI